MENAFHDWLKQHLPQQPRSLIGVGDDAAVLDWSKDGRCVVTTDMLAEGVHFKLAEAGANRVGRKCLAVNLSDMAAMAAQPVAAVVSLMLPSAAPPALAEELLAGMFPLAEEFLTAIVGGDTNVWSGDLVVSITLLGVVNQSQPFRRDGARPGDTLFVTGPLGGSILGHHLDFTPRIQLAQQLAEQFDIHAAMDISDGLALDAARMGSASGCGIHLVEEKIPISGAAKERSAAGSGKTPLQHAISDGEDFELLLAMSPAQADEARKDSDLGLVEVGFCSEENGLWLITADGKLVSLKPIGFEHGKARN